LYHSLERYQVNVNQSNNCTTVCKSSSKCYKSIYNRHSTQETSSLYPLIRSKVQGLNATDMAPDRFKPGFLLQILWQPPSLYFYCCKFDLCWFEGHVLVILQVKCLNADIWHFILSNIWEAVLALRDGKDDKLKKQPTTTRKISSAQTIRIKKLSFG
jgi:hypothetical protein